MRYFIEIVYNGTNYHGWQLQPDAISVQEVIEKALSTLLREEIGVTGAGRTDSGVHAKQLFAHFDHKKIDDLPHLCHRLNSFLPKDIAILGIQKVKEEAHARFDATEREYKYLINLRKDPFTQEMAHYLQVKPNIVAMNTAAKLLLDHEDFQCFSRSRTDVKTYICDVRSANWEEVGDSLIFRISADRFLRNMVRAIVGTLLDIGNDKLTVEDFKSILASKDRTRAGASVPACGLYLTRVSYPSTIYL